MDIIDLDFPISIDAAKSKQLKEKVIVIKYGGNAMVNETVKQGIIEDIVSLKQLGVIPVIVHGGGPAIKDLLDRVGVESEFIGGHRKTDTETMSFVEMALSGRVNSEIVNLINDTGLKAVGISGKDGGMVTAKKRTHNVTIDGDQNEVDLGHVGDVASIDTSLVQTLIANNYVPVISPIAAGEDLDDYNINADMFAGHIAGALKAYCYVAMTNVDGLLLDPDDPSTMVDEISLEKAQSEIGKGIRGGMIPKVESCIVALKEGVETARIVNGTLDHSIIQELLTADRSGTLIKK